MLPRQTHCTLGFYTNSDAITGSLYKYLYFKIHLKPGLHCCVGTPAHGSDDHKRLDYFTLCGLSTQEKMSASAPVLERGDVQAFSESVSPGQTPHHSLRISHS